MFIDFRGYAAGFIVSGRVDLTADRLTDQLNRDASLELADVTLESLVDGRTVTIDQLALEPRELFAAKALGPRGDAAQRIVTVQHRLQAQIGPYNVLGRLHAEPGVSPLESVLRRWPMIPLTEATIAYVIGGVLEIRDGGTIIINRELATWVRDPEADEQTLATTEVLAAAR